MNNKRNVLRFIKKDHRFLVKQAKLYESAYKLIRRMLGNAESLEINIPYKLKPLKLHGMMLTITGVKIINMAIKCYDEELTPFIIVLAKIDDNAMNRKLAEVLEIDINEEQSFNLEPYSLNECDLCSVVKAVYNTLRKEP